MLSSLQASFLFPAAMVPSVRMPADASPLVIKAADGRTDLHGIHYTPSVRSDPAQLIVGFGGNGWNAIDTARTLRSLFPDRHVVVFFYRGYAPSGGEASAEALIEDAPLVHDAARRASGAKGATAVGFSIGTGVVARLATQRPLEGVILVTPFDTLEQVAADHFPWVPMGGLFRHQMDSIEALRSVNVPVAIVAAERDGIILPRRTDALRRALGPIAFDRTIPGVGHNDIYDDSAFPRVMRQALESLGKAQ